MQQLALSFRLSAVLFAFWVVLSGKFDLVHLSAGAASSLIIAIATARLWSLPPAIGLPSQPVFAGLQWTRAAMYVPWLAREILLASLQVARVVLHPRMPIEPAMVRFPARLPHTLARLTLANSITLTPGTVTLEVDGDDFIVHALMPASAAGIEAIQRRVSDLFPARAAAAAAPREGS